MNRGNLLRLTWALVAIIGLLYVGIVLALSPYRGFWSGDAGVKLWQMKAWIDNGWCTPWAPYAEANAAFDPDHALAPLGAPFAVWEGDRVLTIYTLPYIFVSSFLLAAGGQLALYLPPLAAGMGGLVLAVWIGRCFSNRVALLAVLALGLGTSWLFYSVTFWGHTVASFLVWTGLALVLPDCNGRASRVRKGVGAGLCLGAAMAARPEAVVSVLALLVVLVFRRSTWSKLGWSACGLGLAGLVGWVYQASIVGQTIGGQASMNFAPSAFETGMWSVGRLFEVSQMVVESRQLGVLVILTGGLIVFGLAFVYRRLRPDGMGQMSLAVECIGLVLVAVGLMILLARDHHPMDLLFGVPVGCLVFLGLGWTRPAETGACWRRQLAVWCMVVLVLSVALGRQHGGWQWGSRYLTPLLGPLVLLGIEKWERLERKAHPLLVRYAIWAVLVALIVAGMVVQGVGVVTLWRIRAASDALSRALLREAPVDIVVATDIWFTPQIAPDVYGEVSFFVVRTAEEWRELEERLAERDVERVRVVRLTGYETPLIGNIAADWCVLAGTEVQMSTIPSLTVVDYVPREP